MPIEIYMIILSCYRMIYFNRLIVQLSGVARVILGVVYLKIDEYFFFNSYIFPNRHKNTEFNYSHKMNIMRTYFKSFYIDIATTRESLDLVLV